MDELEKVNILLVDDQPTGLIALEAVLSSPEYNLVQANSGLAALKHLLEMDFALILMDVRMPEMDGLETAKIIKTYEKVKHVPIIFITGIDEDERFIYRGYEAGAVDYLFKPFDAIILKSKVAIYTELFRKNRTIQKQAELLRQSELAKLELESLKRFRNLEDAIPHLVWEANANGDMGYFNHSWCEYTQMNITQSWDLGWQAAFQKEDLKEFLNSWKSAKKSGDSFECECRIRRGADNVFRWHLVRMIPGKDASGNVIVWLGTGTDIHYRKEVEEELRMATARAEEATRAKSAFLAAMSHEIRTPMNAIVGMAQLLWSTVQTEEKREYVKIIRKSCQTLLALINDILDFSKIESGKMELEIINFNLKQLIQNCEDSFSTLSQEKGLELVSEIESKGPSDFKGDSGRLQQVLMNLIGNAIKFTQKGSIRLKVTVSELTPAPDLPRPDGAAKKFKLQFSVQDTGIGIPKSSMSQLFQPFSQADTSTTRKFGGTGLGLSICKRLVELMGGHLSVTSEVKKGSTFSFEVDLEEGKPVLQVEDQAIPAPRKANKNITLLVAEDNSANQIVARRALEKMGYRVEIVGNGYEVLQAIKEVPYDLILMDWRMPEMDGCEATKVIRNDPDLKRRNIPIIAMTANAIKGDAETCIAMGMNDYISKPIDFDLLARKVERWTSRGPEEISLASKKKDATEKREEPSIDQDEISQIEVLDRTCLQKLIGIDPEENPEDSLLNEFLSIFYSTAPERIRKMKNAAAEQDVKSLFQEAHSLKTNCAYVGAIRMHRLCLLLETVDSNTPSQKVQHLVSWLEKEYELAEKEIKVAQIELNSQATDRKTKVT